MIEAMFVNWAGKPVADHRGGFLVSVRMARFIRRAHRINKIGGQAGRKRRWRRVLRREMHARVRRRNRR